MRSARLWRRLAGALLICGLLEPGGVAFAQSAADKATARQLAVDGIELYNAGKYPEALDKLTRAEQLYDAPVHLIYMARCQVKLGQYVEAAENYRRLTRTQLADNAPQAFKDAVNDAKKELPDVEPKIAVLKIDVQPSGIQGLEVKVDDTAMSVAALGVDRPTNPGTRRVTATAPGYSKAERSIELKPGEKKALTLELEATSEGAVGAGGVGGTGGAGAAGTAGAGGDGGDTGASDDATTGNVGFLLGVRLGGFLPTGQLRESYAMKDYFGAGGGVELRAGVRLFKHYTGLLFGSVASYQPGSLLDATNGQRSSATNRASGSEAGVGFMYAPERGKLGPFAEIDLLFVHRFQVDRELNLDPKPPEPIPPGFTNDHDGACTQTLKTTGTGLRLGGGVQIPLSDFFQLSPYAGVTFGRAEEFDNDDDCDEKDRNKWTTDTGDDILAGDLFMDRTPWDKTGARGKDADAAAKTTHVVVFLGVGGEFTFGGDKRRK